MTILDKYRGKNISPTGTIVKGALLGLGGLVAAVFLFKYLFVIGVVAAAGYIGYKLMAGHKALPGSSRKQLGASRGGDDFERRMHELEEVERKLDAEISRR